MAEHLFFGSLEGRNGEYTEEIEGRSADVQGALGAVLQKFQVVCVRVL